MGVHDLWQVLEPVARKVHLEELKGQVIAVDLSGWIVESQRVQATHNTSKSMHLRNLFFRCAKLLGYGMDLVFVLEGNAPDIKSETLSQRNKSYFPEIRDSKRGGNRPRLRALSEQCRELLSIMGLQCVQSSGEAEATCAILNKKNLVDACMTEDSDVFLYGAALVYRGVEIDGKDPHVLAYKMSDIESQLNLTREKLIAVALLAGCDYFPGVQGVGKETAVKLFSKLGDVDILQRFKSWHTDSKYEELQNKADVIMRKPRHCSICHHPGTPKAHIEEGCNNCGTENECSVLSEEDAHCKCRWHETDSIKREWKLELDVRKKAIATALFPPDEVVQEFLRDHSDVYTLDGSWKQPDLFEFEGYMQRMLYWEPRESREKLLPLLTRWHLLHMDCPCDMLKPERIIKLRNIRNVPLYEVLWSQEQDENPLPESELPSLHTLEPQQLFKQCYPALVDQFLEEINAKKATRKTAKSTKDIREFFKVKAKAQENTQSDPAPDTKKNDGSVSVKKEAMEEQEHEKACGEPTNLKPLEEATERAEQPLKEEQKSEKLMKSRRQVEKKKPVTRARRSPKFAPEPSAQITQYFGSPTNKNSCADDSLAEYSVPLAERIRRGDVHDKRKCDEMEKKQGRKIAGLSDLEISIPGTPPVVVQSPTESLRTLVLSAHDCSPPKRKITSPEHSPRTNDKAESSFAGSGTQFTELQSCDTSKDNTTRGIRKSIRCLFPSELQTAAPEGCQILCSEMENCCSPISSAITVESTPISATTEGCRAAEQSLHSSMYDPSRSLFTSCDDQSMLNHETHSVIVISEDDSS